MWQIYYPILHSDTKSLSVSSFRCKNLRKFHSAVHYTEFISHLQKSLFIIRYFLFQLSSTTY